MTGDALGGSILFVVGCVYGGWGLVRGCTVRHLVPTDSYRWWQGRVYVSIAVLAGLTFICHGVTIFRYGDYLVPPVHGPILDRLIFTVGIGCMVLTLGVAATWGIVNLIRKIRVREGR